jgi:hypothetical protein
MPMPTTTLTPTPTATRTPRWCDDYEHNDDRWHPWGPLQLGQAIQAKLCRGDAEDNYCFDVSTTNGIQIYLQLPNSLVNHTSLWLYAADDLEWGHEKCSEGTVIVTPFTKNCNIPHAGRYVLRLYSDDPNTHYDDLTPYTLRVTLQ